MNTKELNQTIIQYLTESKLKNAILINGSWGSGKTYYIRNGLIEAIKKMENNGKRVVPVYVSLYGIESLNDISKEMFNKTILFGKEINIDFKKANIVGSKLRRKYTWDVAKGTTKSLIKGLITKHLGIEFVLPDIKDYWQYIDSTDVVLILDDLERSRIDITELLGYINNFVEEYAVKTIIVANEEEVKRTFTLQNRVSKYELVKNLNLPIDSQENKFSERFSAPNNTSISVNNDVMIKTDKENLDKKVDYLFPEPTSYETIKEKLIGFTVDFLPDLEPVFSEIAKEKLSNDRIKSIAARYESKNYANIRTFIFSLEMFEKVDRIIDGLGLTNKDVLRTQIIDSIFYLAMTIKDKQLEPKESWFRFDFSFNKTLSDDVSNLLESEVRTFLNTSIIKDKGIKTILIRIDSEISKYNSKQNTSLKDLQVTWLLLEDDDLRARMKDAIGKVYSNSVNIGIYKKLIQYIYFYNELFNDEQIEVQKVVTKLISNIQSEKDHIDRDNWYDRFGMNFSQEIIDEIKGIFLKIDSAVEKHNESLLGDTVDSNNDSANWVENIVKKMSKVPLSNNGDKKSVIGYLKISSLIEKIKNCNLEELNDFLSSVLREVYSFSNIDEFYKNDLDAINELIQGLKQIKQDIKPSDNKRVFSHVLNQIIDFLQQKAAILEKNK